MPIAQKGCIIFYMLNKSKAAQSLGSLGGAKTLKKYGKDHFKKIRQIGVLKAQLKKNEDPRI